MVRRQAIRCGFLLISGIALAAMQPESEGKLFGFEAEESFRPQFNSDSAYKFIEEQVAFGSRALHMPGHDECLNYLHEKFITYRAEVHLQQFPAKVYSGDTFELTNIIASYNPEAKKRILLGAHWDTRPFADKDTVMKKIPISGANDGGSGVAVLLEIARILGSEEPKPEVGIDIILFDGEDYGAPHWHPILKTIQNAGKIWWCLGSQYWAKNPHVEDYKAQYGILVDMVGRKNAKFYKEGGSMQFAKRVVRKVWRTAQLIGYDHFFIDKPSPGITDDHIFVNRDANIPMINIIDYEPGAKDYFPPFHHTHGDNLSIIDKETLQAVGETILEVIYNE